MKAMVRHRYGPPEVLHLEEIPKPIPRDDELLVKIHAVSLNLGDWEILTADPLYIAVIAQLLGPKPRVDPRPSNGSASSGRGIRRVFTPKYKILGTDIAGKVEAVGKDVTRFRPGNEVFGMCGFGAFAEYTCVPEKGPLARKPPGMSFDEAAAIPQAAFIALQGLRDKARVRPGHHVLINGAGTFAVQLAKSMGAEVTGVDGGNKLDLLRSVGADHVIDYTREDFTEGGERYDVILDLASYHSVFECLRALKPGGIHLVAGGSLKATLQSAFLGPLISRTGSKRVVFLLADDSPDDLTHMTELFEAGTVVPVIDKRYPLSDAGEALRQLGEKHSLGKIIVTM